MTREISFPAWWWVYRAIGHAAAPFVSLAFSWRAGRDPFLAGRLGAADLPAGRLWIHAVSVGETRAAEPLVRAWLDAGRGPILLTAGTRAGHALAVDLFSDVSEEVAVRVAPFDLPGPVARFLDAAAPRAALFVETELWPTILGECGIRGVPTGWVNGRISDRTASARGVFRAAQGWMVRRMDPRLLRGIEDLERARALAGDDLGACLGDLKYDRVASAAAPDPVAWGVASGAPVLVAGSVHDGEHLLLLETYRRLRAERPALRLVLAPRRLELSEEVVEAAGDLEVAKWSLGPSEGWDVLVVDGIGALAGLYRWGTVALVGGSWISRGGHNPLEPAAAGVPALFGPSMDNFRGAARDLVEAGAARSVLEGDVEAAVRHWLDHPEDAARAGSLGKWVVEVRSGAGKRIADEVAERLAALEA